MFRENIYNAINLAKENKKQYFRTNMKITDIETQNNIQKIVRKSVLIPVQNDADQYRRVDIFDNNVFVTLDLVQASKQSSHFRTITEFEHFYIFNKLFDDTLNSYAKNLISTLSSTTNQDVISLTTIDVINVICNLSSHTNDNIIIFHKEKIIDDNNDVDFEKILNVCEKLNYDVYMFDDAYFDENDTTLFYITNYNNINIYNTDVFFIYDTSIDVSNDIIVETHDCLTKSKIILNNETYAYKILKQS